MKTKPLITAAALFYATVGLTLSFFPQETVAYLQITPSIASIFAMKLMSALYLAFGIMNWTVRGSLIGGIYNRPISIGNLMHFAVGAIALVKTVFLGNQKAAMIFLVLTIIYLGFAIMFGIVFISDPTKKA
ncbi:hypothetical protein [Flagellimonas sp.]|uniref:hypothetical protein n=1 Tax=Flagellimonas sp. TaxID=2058762 RepID=UPI003C7AA3C7